MTPHPTRICDNYLEGGLPCEECMSPQEEIDFWQECYRANHNVPGGIDNCPTYYNGCNCGGAMVEEIEFWRNKAKELKDDPEFDATDAAHPAWWRGNDYGVLQTVSVINKIIDDLESKDVNVVVPHSFGSEEINKLQDRLNSIYLSFSK